MLLFLNIKSLAVQILLVPQIKILSIRAEKISACHVGAQRLYVASLVSKTRLFFRVYTNIPLTKLIDHLK